jgi:hypothetical protein
VELNVVPLTEQYWERVVSHCLAEIRAGRTPNPDVLCNSRSVLALRLIGIADSFCWQCCCASFWLCRCAGCGK